MKAEAIRMPSPKQCTLSPVSTAQPPPLARACVRMVHAHGRASCMRRAHASSRVVVMLVPVVPQLGLVEQEEEHQPEQQHAEQHGPAAMRLSKASGSRCMKAVASSAPAARLSRMLRIHAAGAAAHAHAQQQRGDPDASDAGDQGRGDDG